MYSTKRECCDEHYSWNPECMGGRVGNTGRKYYPDWAGDHVCKNDGEGPTYMALNPSAWLYDTLLECCKSVHVFIMIYFFAWLVGTNALILLHLL